jgi:hypothetical protein
MAAISQREVRVGLFRLLCAQLQAICASTSLLKGMSATKLMTSANSLIGFSVAESAGVLAIALGQSKLL